MFRVMIVDDEPMAIKRFESLLNKTGKVSLAAAYTDPEDALRHCRHVHVDIAFVDIEMPGMNGLLLAEKLQEIDPMLEIIMVTAHDQYALEAFRAHAVGYLLKPVSLEEVDRLLDRMEKHRGRQESGAERQLQIQVFKQFQCFTDNRKPDYFQWRTAKARELAAFLHHQQGTPVTRDVILDTLWPEMELERAAKNFHATSYYLREVLRERHVAHLLERSNGAYRLKWEDIGSDEKELLLLWPKVKAGTAERYDLELVLERYTGRYCGENDYPWAEDRQYYYETLFQQALNQLADQLFSAGDRKGAVMVLQKLLQIDPFEENTHEKIIDLHLKNEDRTAACLHFKEMRKLFHKELGIDPPVHLRDKILRG